MKGAHMIWKTTLFILLSACMAQVTFAAKSNSVNKVAFSQSTKEQLKITLSFAQTLAKKKPFSSFVTKRPPRLIIDLPKVTNGLGKKAINISSPLARRLLATQAQNRTRIVIDLKNNTRYQSIKKGNRLIITLGKTDKKAAKKTVIKNNKMGKNKIRNIDFKRMPGKGGQLLIELAQPGNEVDLRQQDSKLVLDFIDTYLPKRLRKNLDVTDFATPFKNISVKQNGKNVSMTVQTHGQYTHLAYQTGKRFVLDINAVVQKKKRDGSLLKTNFHGEKVSLNFQNIEVRAVLQLLAEFTGLNVVTDDSVQGTITLHLQNVPWDQALSIILKTRGLAERQIGNVILVAPAAALAKREQQDMKSFNQIQNISPLHTSLLQVNYARASDIAELIKSQQNSLLSNRGRISSDLRTNTIWLRETQQKLGELRAFIKKLDVPVRQVLIEARIVEVNRDFNHELGVQFGVSKNNTPLSGSIEAANLALPGNDGFSSLTDAAGINKRLNVNLPVTATGGATSHIGVALAKLGHGFLLDLELSALETENKGRVVSSPHVLTANQHVAKIESGEEVPYQQASSSGATNVAFKKAVLSLEVTPQITPNNKVILTIKIHKDEVSATSNNTTVPGIKTNNIETQTLIEDGGTIVLGGVYKETKNNNISRVPFFSSIPLIGKLFQNKKVTKNRSELLVFLTPTIIKQNPIRG